MGFSIKLNEKQIRQKVSGDDVRIYAHTELRDYSDRYVPFRTGRLSKDVRISPEYLHYLAPYAVYCFFANFNFRKDYHPDATRQWVYVMWQNHSAAYLSDLRRYIISRL